MSWLISFGVLGVLVFVHELGHFLVARWSGVRIEKFAIGFGPVIAAWASGGVEYSLRAIPLGGFVKMAGEQPGEVHEGTDGFLQQPARTRALIVLAGPAVNYLTSVVALWVVLIIGYPELLPSVGRLVDNMPAQAAGLQLQDRIRTVNGEPVRTWEQLTKHVHQSAGRPMQLEIERSGQRVPVTVTPSAQEITDPFGRRRQVGLIGIAPDPEAVELYRVGPLQAVRETFTKQAEWTKQMGLSLWSLATGRVSFRESFTGPIGIIYMTSEAVRRGLGILLYLVSVFSLSLAIFNLFPLPILDGGHLFFLLIERLRGAPVSIRTQEHAARVSFALLMALLLVVCVNDVSRFGLMQKFLGLWKG
jgi:regulator of sigma E protease